MSTYEIEREDKVVIFQEADTYNELDKFMNEYRINNPTQSMESYELNDDMERINKSVKKYIPAEKDNDIIKNAQADISRFLHDLFNSLPDDVQDRMITMEHNCDQCDDYDECMLPYKDEDEWIDNNENS